MVRPHLAGIALVTAFGLTAIGEPADAAGGGGSNWADHGPTVSQDPDYTAGVEAAQRRDWNETLARMNAVVRRDDKNADAWNYLGYAYRNLGRMDESFRHYEQALRLDPDHRGAHEYVGEAYLQLGNLASAEVHLRALERLCRVPCEEYTELKEKVEAYRRGHPQ
jgi:tetratricopeptide (TPR) repeat protein